MKQSIQHFSVLPNTSTERTSPMDGQGSKILMPPRGVPIVAYNREELIGLLAILEGELQARDIAIAVLRVSSYEFKNNLNIVPKYFKNRSFLVRTKGRLRPEERETP